MRFSLFTVVVSIFIEGPLTYPTEILLEAHARSDTLGCGYNRPQVERAFSDAEAFMRFWEPQKSRVGERGKLVDMLGPEKL